MSDAPRLWMRRRGTEDFPVDVSMVEATVSEVVAWLREQGAGETFWMMPEEQEHLRGTLWSGPPMSLKGLAVLVVPVDAALSPTGQEGESKEAENE